MNYKVASTVTAILTACAAQAAQAQTAEAPVGIEEVTVTATRRTESLQDVPIAIQALTGDTLSQLNVSTMDEYIKYLPSVSTASVGPGQSNIYMRGLSVGALGTQGSGTNGPWPNVAVYLDEQSTQVPGRNLDLYAADLERIEVLTGPQGTLFGAGAQAGVLRFITNKPVLNLSSAKVSGGYANTAHGSDGFNVEGVVNIPIGDNMAARVVAYQEHRGGYIDNVFSTFTRRGTDFGFANRTGGVVPADSVVIDNADIVDNDINEVDYQGARASLKWQVSDDWDALLAVSYQRIDVEGVFYQLPLGSEGQDLKPLEVTLFNRGYVDEKFINTALTVNGKVGALDFIYTGGYLTRDSDVANDYTNYARGVWGSYYQCTGFSGASVDKCYSPSSVWFDSAENRNMSHEIRLSSPIDWRMRFVTGLFYEDRKLEATTDWTYKTVPECPDSGVSTGSCFLYLDPRAAPKFQSATLNNPNRRGKNIGFFNDFTRDYTQFAAFASVDFDILENLTLTLGTRYYDIDNSMVGANMGSFYCKVYGTGESGPCDGTLYGYGNVISPYGTNVDEQPENKNKVDGFRSRANLTWRATENILFYTTWSEGYRPGGFNRGSACGLRSPVDNTFQWCFPFSYDSDDLTNIEIGWKTTFADRRIQFNGAIYREKWENAQTILFAPQLGFPNLTANLNGPEYEVNGIEVNLAAAPIEGLTITAAASYNDGTLKNSPQVTNNIPGSPNFGQPITESCLAFDAGTQTCTNVVSVQDIYGQAGTELANSPPLQFNIRARYEWARGDWAPYVGAAVQYQDPSFSSAINNNRFKMPSWTTWDAAFGVAKDSWTAEFYVVNLTDEDASLFTTAAQFILAEVPIRPRTMGLRFSYQFGGR
jgi:outer membrane receptor protein involved in Fe transport